LRDEARKRVRGGGDPSAERRRSTEIAHRMLQPVDRYFDTPSRLGAHD
jgi:hypothetical protein